MTYKADQNGLISGVHTGDVQCLLDAGAARTTIPHTKHLKVAPMSHHHFLTKMHMADAHGILRDVPHDTAMILIANGSATEATAEEVAHLFGEVGESTATAVPEIDPALTDGESADEGEAEPEDEGVHVVAETEDTIDVFVPADSYTDKPLAEQADVESDD